MLWNHWYVLPELLLLFLVLFSLLLTENIQLMVFSFGLGFIKFLEPYYMLLITKRRKIGTICGHTIYAITKSEMIPVPHHTVRSKMAYSKDENRSLVHSICKCNMSMVHLRRLLRAALRIIPSTLYLDENNVILHGYLFEFILLLSDNILFFFLYKKVLLWVSYFICVGKFTL